MRSFGSWRITDLLLVDGYADGVNVGLGIGVEALFGEPPDGLELTFLDCASQRLQTAAHDGNRANREMNLQPLRWCIEGRRQPTGRARCGGARQRCFASPANAARFDPTGKLLRKACDMIEIHTMSV